MLYELRTYRARPDRFSRLVALASGVGVKIAAKYAKLAGHWTTEMEGVNEIVQLWQYEDFADRTRAAEALARDKGWQRRYMVPRAPLIERVRSMVLVPADVWPYTPPSGENIYELRNYRLHPGKTREWLDVWRRGMSVRQEYSKPVGIWYSELGELNRIVHLWPYKSLAHRYEVRTNALGEELWRETVATLATLMQAMESTILLPTAASPLK